MPAPVLGYRVTKKNDASRIRNFAINLLSFLLLAGLTGAQAQERELGALARHGRSLAEKMCSQCHAIGIRGLSPHIGAPPFRTLSRRVDLDTFAGRLRDGLTSGHPDMPTFRFNREDARALAAYLRSIQSP